MHHASMPPTPPANDAGGAGDIRVQLRRDHALALQELEALRGEKEERRCRERLRYLRQAWVIHALAEENVVYRALEGVQSSGADERFIEHELLSGLFDELGQARPGTTEWNTRLNVIRDLIIHHIEGEHADLFARLSKRFDAEGLQQLGERFNLVRQKLQLLEQAKAA